MRDRAAAEEFVLRPARSGGAAVGMLAADPSPPEIAALLLGLKPVAYVQAGPERLGALETFCRGANLRLRPLGRRPDNAPTGGRGLFLIGRSERELSVGEAAWSGGVMTREWGKALGYPSCCVDAYLALSVSLERDVVRAAAARRERRGPISYLLNNLCNFYSRVRDDNRAQFELVSALSPTTFHVAFWHPCSYDCAESLARARRVAAFLERRVPSWLLSCRRLLQRAFVYVDDFRFTAVSGAGEEPASLLEPALAEKLRADARAGRDLGNALLLDFTAE